VSKAFVNEDASTPPPSARIARRTGDAQRYLTVEGHDRLEKELEAARAALGQLHKRADPSARADLEARISVLVGILDAATVHAPSSTQAAWFGAWVELEDEDGERVTYRLVGPDEVDVRAGLISVESPLGKAILGRQVGDSITVQRPRGARDYEVVAVRATPSDS